MTHHSEWASPAVTIVGGGPGGYEAALVAASLGARTTVIERSGLGGSAVLTDVVPSKTLVATADAMTRCERSSELGIQYPGVVDGSQTPLAVNLRHVNRRLLGLAREQSADIRQALQSQGVRILEGRGRIADHRSVVVDTQDGEESIHSDAILVATGARPRVLPDAQPDGERIFTWTQIYQLEQVPPDLIVVGSGVTGAEFASAYSRLGSRVTLVSSRERVLPGEDPDAASLLEEVFVREGVQVLAHSRARSVRRTTEGVRVCLADGRKITGSHCLMCVGSIPNTAGIGLEEVGVKTSDTGHIVVDGVSRTTASHIYAAGDCTGVLPLASVAAMQGRIAMAHLLGDGVRPLRLWQVASTIFTAPEIATVGVSEAEVASGRYQADIVTLPLHTNARAKMRNTKDGFVKVFARKGSGTVIGGVVVAPQASELIFPLALAVTHKLHVDDLAGTFTVYPSLSGSISEAARRLHVHM